MKPVERILEVLRAAGRPVKPQGEWWVTNCPVHDDAHASLAVKEDPATGKAVVKCFAGCPNEKVLAALGLEVKDLFPQPDGADRKEPVAAVPERPLTVARLAEAKGLSPKFLEDTGLSNYSGGVVMAYRQRDGRPARSRLRVALVGEGRFRWGSAKTRTGQKLPHVPYGLWRLGSFKEEDVLLVVEGESDCWAAWLHGLHALGLPGADTTRLLAADHLVGVGRLCVIKEPDQGGETFVAGMANRLKEIGWKGQASCVSLQETCGVKDVADLHVDIQGDSVAFHAAVRKAIEAAAALPEPAIAVPSDEWDEIEPLETEEEPPEIDLEACLAPVPRVREFVAAIAGSYQVDPAMLSLSCISLAISRAVEVQLGPDWRQPAPIWTCPIAEPGERKTAVFAELTAPIMAYQKVHDGELQDVLARHAAETRSIQKRVETLRCQQARKGDPAALTELLGLEEQLARREDLQKPRLVVMDATPESVIVALYRNGEKLGILSAESSSLENALGRYSDSPNLDIYLQGHEGDHYIYTRRKGDDITLHRPALVMSLCIQPHAARGLLDHEAAIGRGLFGRFLFSKPMSLKGRRLLETAPVPDHLRQWWLNRLMELLALPYPGQVCDVGGVVTRRESQPRLVTLEAGAAELFLAFRAEIERELSPEDGELAHTNGWAEKFAGATGRIALSLQMIQDPAASQITVDVMRAAIAWSEFLIPAFKHAVAAVGLDPVQQQARLIAGWIRRQRLTSFTHREACRRHRSKSFKTKDQGGLATGVRPARGPRLSQGDGDSGAGRLGRAALGRVSGQPADACGRDTQTARHIGWTKPLRGRPRLSG
jgi:hypothetical protein